MERILPVTCRTSTHSRSKFDVTEDSQAACNPQIFASTQTLLR